jgi:hypothetical protein
MFENLAAEMIYNVVMQLLLGCDNSRLCQKLWSPVCSLQLQFFPR